MSDITGSSHWACSEKCKQKKLVTENSISTVCIVANTSGLKQVHEDLGYKHTERQRQQQRQGPLECIVMLENGGVIDFQASPYTQCIQSDAELGVFTA